MSNKQLHVSAGEDFSVFSSLDAKGTPMSRLASHLPVMNWPSGDMCVEANLHVNRLFDKGYSVKGKGGTLATYCTYLSYLLRYCFLSNKLPSELSDADFRFAFGQLSVFDTDKGKPRNNRTSTIKIGAVWLDFLVFVGAFYGLQNFVSETKHNYDAGIGTIKGYKKVYAYQSPDGKIRYRERWNHSVFPTERDPEGRGMPVSESDVIKLRTVADVATSPNFLRQRRLVMLELFEILGFRRLEAVLLRVTDVESALDAVDAAEKIGDKDFTPSITFRSVKKRGNTLYTRTVPINAISLAFIRSYNSLRERHLDELGVKVTPDSAFLVSCTTGKRLRANTLTQEFRILAKKAGILGQCSPHMMRHRFITQAFVKLIRNHELNSPDEFSRMLLDSSRFKQKVREYAGHVSDETLEIYIHLAFDQVASFKKVLDRVELESALDAFGRLADRLRAAQARGESCEAYIQDVVDGIGKVEAIRARVTQ